MTKHEAIGRAMMLADIANTAKLDLDEHCKMMGRRFSEFKVGDKVLYTKYVRRSKYIVLSARYQPEIKEFIYTIQSGRDSAIEVAGSNLKKSLTN